MRALILFVGLALAGCGHTCKQLAQRCDGTRAQLCDTAGKWQTVMDCKDVYPTEANWKCCCKDAKCGCRKE